jgi:hypothetical protein
MSVQGCQITYFQTKNTNLGNFWSLLQWPFDLNCGNLVYFVAIWYILWLFDILFPCCYVVPRKIWQPCVSVEETGYPRETLTLFEPRNSRHIFDLTLGYSRIDLTVKRGFESR